MKVRIKVKDDFLGAEDGQNETRFVGGHEYDVSKDFADTLVKGGLVTIVIEKEKETKVIDEPEKKQTKKKK